MAAEVANKGVQWVAMGWAAFIAENVVLSENRQTIVKYAGVYRCPLT